MRRFRVLAAAGLTMLVMANCAQEPQDEEDGINDTFLSDGKADTAGITENSPEAIGCLAVANKLSQTDLRKKVGLATNAASAIVAVRVGDDEIAGTADDVKFSTLKQLDDVPYVGPLAFGKLLAYARANGYVPAGGTPPPKMDTCPVPTGEFTVDSPNAGTGQHAVLQVPDQGAPRIFVRVNTGSGSFSDQELQQLSRKAPKSWETRTVLSASPATSIASAIAITHGADPCLAYTYDYNRTLRLTCASLSDRVIAPQAYSGVAMGQFGAARQVIYTGSGTLSWVEVNPTAGTPEIIDTSWSFGKTAMQVDASGRPHVVYVAFESGSPNIRTVRYAVRSAGGWTKETIDVDKLDTADDGVSVSLGLVAGQPVVAYYHVATHSLKFARRGTNGWVQKTLSAPPAGFPGDSVGRSVALAVDCMDRIHLVFQRNFTTDAKPNNGLVRAIVSDDKLTAVAAMPSDGTYAPAQDPQGLSFHVAADGRQSVAARLTGNFSSWIYFAQR